jgi:hypothetical protein
MHTLYIHYYDISFVCIVRMLCGSLFNHVRNITYDQVSTTGMLRFSMLPFCVMTCSIICASFGTNAYLNVQGGKVQPGPLSPGQVLYIVLLLASFVEQLYVPSVWSR